MDSDRIDVLHVADSYAVSCTVTHHLIFYFLPACYAALYEYLVHTRKPKPVRKYFLKFQLVMRNPAAGAAQSIRRS